MIKYCAFLACFLALASCDTPGAVGAPCNPDGSCAGPLLRCHTNSRCYAVQPERTLPTCGHESQCWCVTCAEKCGANGVSRCTYSDTSVWGAEPSVCQCK
jgi:hypothetical protein